MPGAVQELLKMGIWHKLFSQPLRYIYYLAGYVSPHRFRSSSPPLRAAPRPVECNLCALDVIVNEQKLYHPSNVFSNSALGHTRSFSTSVSDRARRIPERNKVRENQVERPSGKPAKNRTFIRGSKRRKSEGDAEIRKPSRRSLKKQAVEDEKPPTDIQTFSVPDSRRATSPEPYSAPRSVPLLYRRFSLSEQAEEFRQKLSAPIGLGAQSIKDRLWDTWIAREPFQGRLSSVQLFEVVRRSDIDDHVRVHRL